MSQYMDGLRGPDAGSLGGALIQHDYKRAVSRPAPRRFTAESLSATKFGSGYCYGIRVCPLTQLTTDDQSSKSGGSHSEYDIWRRWGDCLWFQDVLESEYANMARSKRRRLASGKGSPKHALYSSSDKAASFDSLPPGPDANTIAKNIHQILPKLTKKGTLFRASQSTIAQREKEFAALISALFSDDVPKLVKELRETRIVRDFFAYWRLDKDRERKQRRPSSGGGFIRNSVASSTFSMYFSSSNISLQLPPSFSDLPPSPALLPPKSSGQPPHVHTKQPSAAFTSSAPVSPESPCNAFSPVSSPPMVPVHASTSACSGEHHDYFAPTGNPSSKSSSARWSHGSSRSSASRDSLPELEDVCNVPPCSAKQWPDLSYNDFPRAGLQALPEDQELTQVMSRLSIVPDTTGLPPPVRRQRTSSQPDRAYRNCLIFSTPPHGPLPVDTDNISLLDVRDSSLPTTPGSPDRRDWQESQALETRATLENTFTPRQTSVALSVLAEDASSSYSSSWRTSVVSVSSAAPSSATAATSADIERALQQSPVVLHTPLAGTEFSPYSHRASIATIGSIVSNSSVDAILPRPRTSPPSTGVRRSLSSSSRYHSFVPSMTPAAEEVWYEDHADVIDAYFYDANPAIDHEGSVDHAGRSPSKPFIQQLSIPERFPKPFQNRPPGQFHLPWQPVNPTSNDVFTIKAVFGEAIVLLRAAYTTPFYEIRERIREKLCRQEGLPLAESFVMGYLPNASSPVGPNGRPRSASSAGVNDLSRLYFIHTQVQWQEAVASCLGKLTLRVLDSQP